MGEVPAAPIDLGNLSDADLLALVKDRRPVLDECRAAVETLLLRHKGLIVTTVRRVLRDTNDFLDAVQQTSEKATRSLHSCRGSFKSWLVTIARNEAFTIARARAAQGVQPFDADDLDTGEPDPMERLVLQEDESWSPEKIAFLVESVVAVVEGLPDAQKKAFKMKYMDQLSIKQIADNLEKSVTAVTQLIYRAKAGVGDGLGKTVMRYLGEVQ